MNEDTQHRLDLSIVIPLLNEAESLKELYRQITDTVDPMNLDYEIVFVDDGSTDGSFEVLTALHEKSDRVKIIRFRKNYGKSAGLSEGFSMAAGRFVITMDADLQDDPGEIPKLIAKLEEGFDLVSGWKKERHDPLSKTIPSRFFNYTTRLLTGIKIHDFNCGLKAYRGEVVSDVKLYGELHRYIPVLAKWHGYRITEIPVLHHKRKFGKTKFGLSRFLHGFLDLITIMFITKYLKAPMHFFGLVGSLFFLVGLGINVYLTIDWFMGRGIGHRPILFLGVMLILIGIQIFTTGLIAEMITNSNQKERNYTIKDRIV